MHAGEVGEGGSLFLADAVAVSIGFRFVNVGFLVLYVSGNCLEGRSLN